MIRTKKDLSEYLEADSKNYKSVIGMERFRNYVISNLISDQRKIWKYIWLLRHLEYHLNNDGGWKIWHKCARVWYLYRLRKMSYITGFQIPPNTVGKGVTIWHWGTIIINARARIGENCLLYPGVLIGDKAAELPAPIIGNNVFPAGGAKIIGNVTIGDNVTITHNTTIVKNVPANCIVGGSPARIIKQNGVKVNITL